MKLKGFLAVVLVLFLLSSSVYSIQGAYTFMALNFEAMWGGYTCATEGLSSNCLHKPSPINVCITNEGVCKNTVYCSVLAVETRLTIPEDLKFVTSDGTVVGDEICVGDKFKVAKGASKGEYWDDGGNLDSPAVYWVDDIEAVVNRVVNQHKGASPAKVYGSKVSDGYVDPYSGIPVYNKDLMGKIPPAAKGASILTHFNIIGNIACSMKGSETAGGKISKEGEYYKANEPGGASLDVAYTVECTYYYYGGVSDPKDFNCQGSDAFSEYHVPMFPNMNGNSLQDLLKVGTISLKKNLKITTAGKPNAEFSIIGAESVKLGEANNLRVLIKNTGDVDITVKDIFSKAPHKFVSCDKSPIAPGTGSECILSVTPSVDTGLDVTVSYSYKTCGKTQYGQMSKIVLGALKIMPKAAYQAYGIDVKGDCNNAYYACDAPKDALLSIGYRCMKQQEYYTPAAGRADMEYDLSAIPNGTNIASVSIRIKPAVVNKPQKVAAYVYNFGLQSVSCSAGGDICKQPYCKECIPLYNIPGDAIASQEITDVKAYSLDVTEYVKKALSNGDSIISFQLRGTEGLWATQGESQCGTDGYWTKQDVSIQATGADGPALVIVIK